MDGALGGGHTKASVGRQLWENDALQTASTPRREATCCSNPDCIRSHSSRRPPPVCGSDSCLLGSAQHPMPLLAPTPTSMRIPVILDSQIDIDFVFTASVPIPKVTAPVTIFAFFIASLLLHSSSSLWSCSLSDCKGTVQNQVHVEQLLASPLPLRAVLCFFRASSK